MVKYGILLAFTGNISKGERLYNNYNGDEKQYYNLYFIYVLICISFLNKYVDYDQSFHHSFEASIL